MSLALAVSLVACGPRPATKAAQLVATPDNDSECQTPTGLTNQALIERARLIRNGSSPEQVEKGMQMPPDHPLQSFEEGVTAFSWTRPEPNDKALRVAFIFAENRSTRRTVVLVSNVSDPDLRSGCTWRIE